MTAVGMLMLRLGKMRYLITGAAIALLFGLICRGISRVLHPLTVWQRFTGTLTAAERRENDTVLTVTFTDSRRLQHTAAFPAVLPAHQKLQDGTAIRFAMQRTLFESGSYPQHAADASDAAGKILLADAWKRLIFRQILRELMIQLGIWLAAALLCAAAVRICFPKP